jgi:hypothetical protein
MNAPPTAISYYCIDLKENVQRTVHDVGTFVVDPQVFQNSNLITTAGRSIERCHHWSSLNNFAIVGDRYKQSCDASSDGEANRYHEFPPKGLGGVGVGGVTCGSRGFGL